MSTTATIQWDCGSGCPPVHLHVPVALEPLGLEDGDVVVQMHSTDAGQRMLHLAVTAHMVGVHQ